MEKYEWVLGVCLLEWGRPPRLTERDARAVWGDSSHVSKEGEKSGWMDQPLNVS